MKKRVALIMVVFLLSALAISALAAGDAGDPLVSLSYLTGAFTDAVDSRVAERLDAADIASAEDSGSEGGVHIASSWQESRLKAQDVLLGTTGSNVLVLAGGMEVSFPAGTVVDVTTGSAVPSGTALSVNHRYMVAEDTSALFTVTSKTAVVDYQGSYAFSLSDAVDYNAMAGALKTMHLFKGSFTGYGDGYDLEVAPTRLQALIMFIRVLGEEEAALAYIGSTPFQDIAAGSQAEKYVGYAYSKGYTNGYSATAFRPSQAIPVNQYVEFVLRALGYSSAANQTVSDALIRAQECGVLTAEEQAVLQNGTFLRADLVYISYRALDASLSGSGETLRDNLLARGIFTRAEAQNAADMVSDSRK
ncbi:S-layer homology domain-containing protein [Dysosmobacter sp.]